MAVVDESSLRKIPGLTKDQMLSPASPVTMAFRMLNNLKAYYMRFENWSAMLLVTAYQMGIVHDDIALLSLVHSEPCISEGGRRVYGYDLSWVVS